MSQFVVYSAMQEISYYTTSCSVKYSTGKYRTHACTMVFAVFILQDGFFYCVTDVSISEQKIIMHKNIISQQHMK